MSKKRKKIVCFGGGGGMPKLILEPLKDLDLDLVAITSMVDNGGSTGALRKEFNVLPAGDIRRHLLALSEAEEWKKKLWNFRFAKNIEISPEHFGHNFANVFISGLEYLLGDFEKALEITHEFLKVKGKAMPVTLDKVQIIAELEDGSLVEGEDEIDLGQNHNRNLKIKRAYLNPGGKTYKKAIEEIETADFIIIGPGDLYSSLIACFLTEGIKEVMKKTSAKKIFICPAMNKLGETQGYSVKDFAEKIEEYMGISLDFVIFNNNISADERIEKFKEEMKKEFVLDLPKINYGLDENKFIGADLLLDEGEIKYDKNKIFKVLKRIVNF
ncbi:MAG: YvcK family protein [Candidatus Pacebacteria bacterium]|nr:YvcK family protein [Candidatus Paceibacterota bacterium]